MPKEKPKYEFEVDFASQTYQSLTIGRFTLHDGTSIVLHFTPEGLKATIRGVKNSTALHMIDEESYFYLQQPIKKEI